MSLAIVQIQTPNQVRGIAIWPVFVTGGRAPLAFVRRLLSSPVPRTVFFADPMVVYLIELPRPASNIIGTAHPMSGTGPR